MAFVSTTTARDVYDELASRLHEVSADEDVFYRTGINLCTRDIAISFPNAPFYYVSTDRTLSSGTRLYTNLPTDYEKMINVVIPINDNKLKYLTEEEFDAIQPSASETGSPTVYTLHGSLTTGSTQIEFYPVPGTAITLNYQYRSLPIFTSATSASLQIPSKYAELYVLYGEMRGRRRNEEFQEALLVEQKYEALKQQMMMDFKRMTEEPWRIKSIREFTPNNRTYGDEIVDLFWNSDRV